MITDNFINVLNSYFKYRNQADTALYIIETHLMKHDKLNDDYIMKLSECNSTEEFLRFCSNPPDGTYEHNSYDTVDMDLLPTPEYITTFSDTYAFLNNAYEASISYNGLSYRNAEAAFQSMKCPDRSIEFVPLDAKNAKQLGRSVSIRNDWDNIKDNIMYDILRVKFSDDTLRKQLVSTGNAVLVPSCGSYWGASANRYSSDLPFVCAIDNVNYYGYNKLGNILMRIRKEINDKT